MKLTDSFPYLTPLLFLLSLGCSAPDSSSSTTVSDSPANEALSSLTGTWRAVLDSPGGELPFGLKISGSNGQFVAELINGPEVLPLDRLSLVQGVVTLAFDGYDSTITARLEESTGNLVGEWQKTVPDGFSRLPFRAQPIASPRFSDLGHQEGKEAAEEATDPQSIEGSWEVLFTDEDGSEPAVGEFHWQGDELIGTFLTPTGDYRFLAGTFAHNQLRLSTFDGAHAFLFHASLVDDVLTGDFWSRDTYHATWVAKRSTKPSDEALPSPWELAKNTHPEGRFRFSFEDLAGQTVSAQDERFQDKVVLLNIFGSWCPNCNDEAPLLSQWHRQFRDQGLEVVGLAYEFTGELERDREMVRRFGERYNIEYPLLVAGTSDKTDAAETLPDLDVVIAYPTTVFIGRDGKVRKVHSGFAGPGTGEHHQALVAEMEGLIKQLLSEEASSS